MSDLRERVARAICDTLGENWDDPVILITDMHDTPESVRDDFRAAADAAIALVAKENAAEIERLRAALRDISLMDKRHEHDLFSATRVAQAALEGN